MPEFGDYIRARRKALKAEGPGYGLRKVAARIGISPTYLSLLENGKAEYPPSERMIEALASDLGENPDVLLALVGKVSPRLIKIISKRPKLFAQVIEQFADLPDYALVRVVREVRDGEW